MLELTYPIEADEHGVIDGIRLAHAMMRSAVDVLIPYVSTCPACIDAAFGRIANELLETMHKEIADGQENALLFTPGITGAQRNEAIKAHLTAQQSTIRELLLPELSESEHDHRLE